jgi:hypothetical protein
LIKLIEYAEVDKPYQFKAYVRCYAFDFDVGAMAA